MRSEQHSAGCWLQETAGNAGFQESKRLLENRWMHRSKPSRGRRRAGRHQEIAAAATYVMCVKWEQRELLQLGSGHHPTLNCLAA